MGSSLPCFPRIDKEKTSTRYLVVSRAACLSSEQRVLLRNFIGTRLQFSERMSEVASTSQCGRAGRSARNPAARPGAPTGHADRR